MNTKNTKKRLVASLLAMAMCFTMFIGSTFAWFTDEASTAVNKIQSGILDVALVDKAGNSLEGKALSFADKENKTDIFWEPGCTFRTQDFQVVNDGNLEFKYKIILNGVKGDSKLLDVIEFSLLNVVNGKSEPAALEGRSVNDDYGEYKISFEDGRFVSTLTSRLGSNFMYIQAHMDEDAGNEYQGLTLDGIGITVYATQDTVEYDSYGNQYDANAEYAPIWSGSAENAPAVENNALTISTAEELANFAASVNAGNSYAGVTITLANDIDLKDGFWTPIGTEKAPVNGIFDGAGYTVKNFIVDNKDESATCSSGLFGTGFNVATIKNLTVANATVTGYHYVGALAGTVYGDIENCHVINSTINCINKNDDANGDKAGLIVGYFAADSGTVSNCTAKDSSVSAGRDAGQIAGAATTAKVVNCSATNVTVAANGTGTGANINETVIGRVL